MTGNEEVHRGPSYVKLNMKQTDAKKTKMKIKLKAEKVKKKQNAHKANECSPEFRCATLVGPCSMLVGVRRVMVSLFTPFTRSPSTKIHPSNPSCRIQLFVNLFFFMSLIYAQPSAS